MYSIFFFVFVFLINNLKLLPNKAHKQIDGKQITAAVSVTKAVAIKKFSSTGKKPETTVIAIFHALGFMNWNAAASYNLNGRPVSFFTKQSKNKSQGIRNAIFYGVSIIVIYIVVGVGVASIFGSDAANLMANNVYFNIYLI